MAIKTHYQQVYIHLKNKGIDVYAPMQNRDKCTEGYVVIKESGQYATSGNVNGYSLMQIFCYYPKDKYSQLEFFIDNIKEVLDEIDFLKPTGNKSPIMFFEEVQAYGQNIEYQILHKLK